MKTTPRSTMTNTMTAILNKPESPHVCVYPGMFGIGWTCCYGHWMGWSECPIEAAAEVLELAAEDAGRVGANP